MVDCDIYESENWLGTGKCKYSWECRGARQCEGQGWCYGDDACAEVHEWDISSILKSLASGKEISLIKRESCAWPNKYCSKRLLTLIYLSADPLSLFLLLIKFRLILEKNDN